VSIRRRHAVAKAAYLRRSRPEPLSSPGRTTESVHAAADSETPELRTGIVSKLITDASRLEQRAFIDGWNERCRPFVWTKTPDEILAKAHRKKTSNMRH